MKLKRMCMDCGNEFTAVISDKSRHVLMGRYYGKMRKPGSHNFAGRWSTRFLPMRERVHMRGETSKLRRFMSDRFWWYSLPEEECIMSNWKKTLYMLYDWVYEKIYPPEMVELWVCPTCVNSEFEVKGEEID